MSAPDDRQTAPDNSALPQIPARQAGVQILQSFPRLSRPDAQILILGSMPGNTSLLAGQYYAHPRNAFWKIMGELLGFDHTQPYTFRVQHLLNHRIALWDVAQLCVRPGSLDSSIVASSVVANDFGDFFTGHPDLLRVCLNGSKAAALYKKHVLPTLETAQAVNYIVLPSTSPANAATTYPQKAAAWRSALLR